MIYRWSPRQTLLFDRVEEILHPETAFFTHENILLIFL